MTETEELLLAIQSIVKQETEPLAREIQKINIRLDTEISDKLDSLADGFMSLDERTNRIEGKVDALDERTSRMETDIAVMKSDISVIKDDVAAIKVIVSEHDDEIAELKRAQ
mgnify:CR=1 FL=1